MARLVLASASPRRAELLRAAGFDFRVVVPNVDETPLPNESAQEHALRLAVDKARAVNRQIAMSPDRQIVLGADTIVVVDGRALGKPRDPEDAVAMLRALSGRAHDVLTGVAVLVGEALTTACVSTAVTFAALTEDEIHWYVASGEPMDKAGAYAIQGLGARFVTRLDGSYSNVVGLPIETVYRLLRLSS